MNKIKNILSAMLLLALPLAFTACGDDVEYSPADKPVNAQVYFPTTNGATVDLSKDKTSFDVTLMRAKTDEAITVPITATGGGSFFTIPASVSFPQGVDKAVLSISYNPESLEYDAYSEIKLTIGDESATTPYGMAQYVFKAGIPAPWTSLGKATFSDAFLFANKYSVELQRNDLNPSLYRLVDPYSEGLTKEGFTSNGDQSPYVEFTLLKPGDKIGNVTITMEDLVYFPYYCTGFFNTSNDYNTNVDAHHPSDFSSLNSEAAWTFNRVLQYQADGTPAGVQLAPYYYMDGHGGWNNTQADGVVTIIFPGAVLSDFSVTMEYKGSLTDPSGYNYALAAVELGADVTEARLALVPASADLDEVVDGIIEETIEYVSVKENGEVKLQASGNGVYYLVAVSYGANPDGETEAQEASYIEFKHVASSEPATPIEAYAGDWTLDGVIGSRRYTLPVTITKVDEKTLTVQGALPLEGYDDTFTLSYDDGRGYVILKPQAVAPLNDDPMRVVPLNLDAGSFTSTETMTGRISDNSIVFENTFGNQGNWTSFAYLASTEEGASLISYYSSVFAPLASQAQALSFKSLATVAVRDMKLVKVAPEKTAKSVNLNIFIKNLNGNSWERRSLDTGMPVLRK